MILTTKLRILIKPPQDQTSVEPNKSPNEITQQNLLKMQKLATQKFKEQSKIISLELQQLFSEVFSLEHTQTENELLRLLQQNNRSCKPIIIKTGTRT